ncbi:heptahelical transmembrane protein 1 [Actinidia eriantha]|uniref:heptahelical transmembrane protein 1 n=1 Tax=Actinidia eriantha TaxID=165200 RepID=UPI00258F91B2|nr:heptahelical transmembrane protein 1 [Actinidia eriantha]
MSTSKGSVWRKKKREMDQNQSILNLESNNQKNKKSQKRSNQTKQYGLVGFEELPAYMKDNEYILKYYRANWPLKQAFFSLFRWHNETLNVWTHLIGFALFLGLTVANLMHVPQVADFFGMLTRPVPTSAEANFSHNSKDFYPMGSTKLINLKQSTPPEMAATRWPFFVFLGGSMFCLLSSTTCHLFACHSHHLNLQLLRMDYVGITVMIITSFFPPIYYIFQCEPLFQILYLSGITVMGVSVIFTLLTPIFSSGKFRSFRALLFVAMGLFGLVPAVHALVLNWNDPKRNVTLGYESAMAVFYLTGTMFYVSRIPEKWRPGWFDLAGQSHQIFHVFVILGALAHYGAAIIFLEYRGKLGCEKIKS